MSLEAGKKGTLLIGYDTEAHWAPQETVKFLEIAQRVHEELGVPCTLFIVGKVLEMNPAGFQRIVRNPLFDLQQHTYSHMRLKPVTIVQDGKPQTLDCGSAEEVREELAKTNDLFRRFLGAPALGLTGPYANHYTNGLRDAPQMLKVIHECGIRFLRCCGKEGNDLPLESQPFWYSKEGYPDLLEFPLQKFGYDGYKDDIPWILRTVSEKGYFWDHLQHDWDIVEHDPEMSETRRLVSLARELGIEVASYRAAWQRLLGERRG